MKSELESKLKGSAGKTTPVHGVVQFCFQNLDISDPKF